MTLMPAGKTVAILVANGFDENQTAEIQRGLARARAVIRTIAPEPGVVNGWQGEGWGHHFPVDQQIGEALGSDFDALVLPGGARGVARLKTNPHARRIVNHFLEAGKPVAAIGDGVALLALSDKVRGRLVAAPAGLRDELKAAGAEIGDAPVEIEGNVLTAEGDDPAAWVEETLAFFGDAEIVRQAA